MAPEGDRHARKSEFVSAPYMRKPTLANLDTKWILGEWMDGFPYA